MRFGRVRARALAIAALIVLASPGPAWAADFLSVHVTGAAAGDTLTIYDTVSGQTYADPAYDPASGAWVTGALPLNDNYLAQVLTPSGEAALTGVLQSAGSQTVGGNVYFGYSGAVTLPADPATAVTWTTASVTQTSAVASATAIGLEGVDPGAALAISSPTPGVTLTPLPNAGATAVGGVIYGNADAAGSLGVAVQSATAGAAVTIHVASGGTLIGEATIQLAGPNGPVPWADCGPTRQSECITNVLVNGGPPPAGFTAQVASQSQGGATEILVRFTNGQAPTGDGSNADELFGTGPGQIPPGSTVTLTLDSGAIDPTALTATGQVGAFGVSAATGGYQLTVTATPTAASWVQAGCPIGGTCGNADHDFTGELAWTAADMAGVPAPAGYAASTPWSSVLAGMRGVTLGGNAQSQALPTVDAATGALAFQVAAPDNQADGVIDLARFSAFVPDALVQTLWGLAPGQAAAGSWTGTTSTGGAATGIPALQVSRATENTSGGTVGGFVISGAGLPYSTDQIELMPVPAPLLTAATPASSSEIDLSWQPGAGAPAAGVAGYDVYESSRPGGPFALVSGAAVSGSGMPVLGLVPSTKYYFRITAVTASGQTAPSAVLAGTTLPPAPPPAPTGLTATAASASEIDLVWNTDPGATGYNVYRAASANGRFTQINTAPVTATYYSDTGLTGNTTYYYYVTGVSADGEGNDSTLATATTLPPSAIPSPGGLLAAPVSGGAPAVALTWNTDQGAASYNIYRSTVPSGVFTKVNAAPVQQTSYTDSGLTGDTTYYYYVTAVDTSGESPPSAPASATTDAAPAGPTGLTATPVSAAEVDLTWTPVPDATGYNVYQSATATGGFTELTTSPVAGTSYANTGLAAATTYFYQVTAVTPAGESTPSAAVDATTASGPLAPAATATIDAAAASGLLSQAPQGATTVAESVPMNAGVGALAITAKGAAALLGAGQGVTASFGGSSVAIPAADLSASALAAANPNLSGQNLTAGQLVFSLHNDGALGGTIAGQPGDPLLPGGDAYTLGATFVSATGAATPLAGLPQPVGVSLAYDATGVSNPELLGVYRVPAGQTPIYTPGALADIQTTTVGGSTAALGRLAPLAATPSFIDTAGSWAAPYIAVAAAHHLVDGVDPTHFDPNAQVTRAQFTAMLVRALNLQPGANAAAGSGGQGLQFVDVPGGAWYAKDVATAVGAGLVTGVDAIHFDPNSPITREQMAVLVARFKARTGSGGSLGASQAATVLSKFADAPSIAPWAAGSVAYAVQSGLLNGVGPASFAPLATATRAEAATVLVRALGGK